MAARGGRCPRIPPSSAWGGSRRPRNQVRKIHGKGRGFRCQHTAARSKKHGGGGSGGGAGGVGIMSVNGTSTTSNQIAQGHTCCDSHVDLSGDCGCGNDGCARMERYVEHLARILDIRRRAGRILHGGRWHTVLSSTVQKRNKTVVCALDLRNSNESFCRFLWLATKMAQRGLSSPFRNVGVLPAGASERVKTFARVLPSTKHKCVPSPKKPSIFPEQT